MPDKKKRKKSLVRKFYDIGQKELNIQKERKKGYPRHLILQAFDDNFIIVDPSIPEKEKRAFREIFEAHISTRTAYLPSSACKKTVKNIINDIIANKGHSTANIVKTAEDILNNPDADTGEFMISFIMQDLENKIKEYLKEQKKKPEDGLTL